ncbi:biotin-protein ligase [Pseudomassariella vexata]|uniref:Biotin-protein ligase n=1 Tax=Pseudomassariella vexata TaxID=1141098 RepID=A0A1Y2DRX3_9PEZI|nr:biotin-protein ligase [Pseudomassariella vexata]ORY61435.1 biotin-protein ligase [Pseudomassariella vexata]
MAPRKLNVLVYTGAGSTVESVKHAVYSLRRLLSPNYAVIPITDTVLLKEPWAPTCALLVFPGGADLGYCRVLNGAGNILISQYVRRGGAYLGFCAGGYYGSTKCEFEVGNKPMEVVGSRELAFFPGTCRGAAFQGFQYQSEKGARAVKLIVKKDAFKSAGVVPDEVTSYYNGGGVFVPFGDARDYEVLASYASPPNVDGGDENPALVMCKVGMGSALLTGPHPEFSPANLEQHCDIPGYDDLIASLRATDEARTNFFKACLGKLGLDVNQETSSVPSLSRLHLSSLGNGDVDDLLHSWEEIITRENGEEFIKGENDTFHLEKRETRWGVVDLKESLPSDKTSAQPPTEQGLGASPGSGIVDYNTVTKRMVIHDSSWPGTQETPYFNHHAFYGNLKAYRDIDTEAEEWGDFLLYGEVVTSTNTLLDKNHNLLSKAPSGFTLTATTQIAGRGRGSNVWVSPAGSLVFSTVINHPAHLAPSRPIVFIQYISAIAIVEAIKTYDKGYTELPVKLKWPNDIYAVDPSKPASPPTYVKIGGILSNCAYSSGSYQIVLGIGLNTTNGRPTTSLDALLPSHLPPFRIEKLLARILTRIEVLYKQFLRQGFSKELEELYYSYWLHGRQIVTLEAHGGVKARIMGITTDWGLLKAEELGSDDRPTGKMWALQSDENSFDFFRNLVKRKL